MPENSTPAYNNAICADFCPKEPDLCTTGHRRFLFAVNNNTPTARLFSTIDDWLQASAQADSAAHPDCHVQPRYLFSDYSAIQRLWPFGKQFYEITLLSAFPAEGQETSGPALVFVGPGRVFSPLRDKRGKGFSLYFTPRFLPAAADRPEAALALFDAGAEPVCPVSKAVFDDLWRVMEMMWQELHHPGPEPQAFVLQQLLGILLYKCQLAVGQPVEIARRVSRAAQLAAKFRQLLDRHFLTHRTVAEFARLMDITPGHLNDSVKDSTGLSASAFISARLLEEAQKMLAHTDEDVARIGEKLQFANPSHFGKFFKKATGETPLSYRKKARSGSQS